jgi:hypothetical protein
VDVGVTRLRRPPAAHRLRESLGHVRIDEFLLPPLGDAAPTIPTPETNQTEHNADAVT